MSGMCCNYKTRSIRNLLHSLIIIKKRVFLVDGEWEITTGGTECKITKRLD